MFASVHDLAEALPAKTGLHSLSLHQSEAAQAAKEVLDRFDVLARKDQLPLPATYNADPSLAQLCYAFASCLRASVVLETGVGYGITSAVILTALAKNEHGRLLSLDLPSLGDADGSFAGIVVPEDLRSRWTLALGSSRRNLPTILRGLGKVDLFLSDSANIYTLQRRELQLVWPYMTKGAVAILNDVDGRVARIATKNQSARFFAVKQQNKRGATGIVVKC